MHYGFSCAQQKQTTVLHVSADVRFRNHLYPQSLTCVYVTETQISVPETYYFVPSTVGNVKLRFGNLTDFSVFLLPLLYKYVQKLGYSFAVTKFSSWTFSLFLHEISLRVFFSVNLHAMKTCSLYKSDKYIRQ